MAENLRASKPLDDEALMPMLLAASREEDHKIALRAALALAAVGGESAIKRLEQMLQEPQHVDVHYNAATGLARWGDPAATDTLLEMLDPDEQRAVAAEPTDEAKAYKRAVIYFNALKATRMLAERNAGADLTPLAEAVQRLLDEDLEKQIRMEATSTLAILQQRR
jgi:HEAT repeat protein